MMHTGISLYLTQTVGGGQLQILHNIAGNREIILASCWQTQSL